MSFPYEDTQEQIRQSITSRMGDSVSTLEGSFGDIVPRAVSYELWRFYTQLRALTGIAFPDANSGKYLDMKCNEYGITRKQAGFAVVILTFNGNANTNIPKNTAVQTADGLIFNTESAVKIPESGTVEVLAKAENSGVIYNVKENTITKMLTSINGVSSVTNAEFATGGYDEETSEALYERLNMLRQSRATSGNTTHYEQWALEVEGVGAARCIEVWDGANTVLVVIASADLLPVDQGICDKAKEYIETKRPVGAIVTVKSAEAVTLNINAEIVLENNAQLESVKNEFNQKLTEYLKSVAFGGEQVIYARVLYLLLGITGVADYKSFTINGDTQNIALQKTNVPTIGEVNIVDSKNT